MNTKIILLSLLTSTLALTGCELLDDLADTDSDGESMDETGGDEDEDTGGDEEDDEDEDDGNEPADTEGESADGPSEEDAGEPAEESGGADTDEPSADTSGGTAECDVEGLQVCVEENVLAVCIDGEVIGVDCSALCAEDGAVSAGCFLDEESGVDVCWCDYGGGEGEGGA